MTLAIQELIAEGLVSVYVCVCVSHTSVFEQHDVKCYHRREVVDVQKRALPASCAIVNYSSVR